jgi:hypothetical protein
LDSAKININKINYFYSLKKGVPIPWPNGLVSQKNNWTPPFHRRRLLFINFWFWFCCDFFFYFEKWHGGRHPSKYGSLIFKLNSWFFYSKPYLMI